MGDRLVLQGGGGVEAFEEHRASPVIDS